MQRPNLDPSDRAVVVIVPIVILTGLLVMFAGFYWL